MSPAPSTSQPTGASAAEHPPGRLRTWWSAFVAAIGAVGGIAPHVLHHVGLLAGTALVAGTSGSLLFGVLGLAASVPFLLRLRRRFRTWWAPAIALTVFAAMFSLSTFVIGPAIGGGTEPPGNGPDSEPAAPTDHDSHHK